MTTTMSVAVPLVRVQRAASGKSDVTRILAGGDRVEFVERTSTNLVIETTAHLEQPDGSVLPVQFKGYLRHKGKATASILGPSAHGILAVDFVDVQQGDAAVVESPQGKVMIIDGGENQLFARYLANRFWGTTAAAPREIDTVVVSHGDADHFVGLRKVYDSEHEKRVKKRLFMDPRRVYHNGLAKGPSALKDVDMFGAHVPANGREYIVDLVDDLRTLPEARLNQPFRMWKEALADYGQRAQAAGRPFDIERLERGATGKFPSFAAENIDIDVLAPITETVPTPNGPKPALPFLSEPKVQVSGVSSGTGTPSASHTINGQSVVLRLTYGKCRILFTGDLNNEAEQTLIAADAAGTSSLESDVLKVPHHGSADFSKDFLKATGALVSVVSSGDESARKEYIHPRATLVGGLGRYSRTEDPLVFITELVAFFATEGWVTDDWHAMTPDGVAAVKRRADLVDVPARKAFYSFSRSAFGAVHLRTDGQRLLVWTDSALADMKEAYSFDLTKAKPVLSSVDVL